MNEVSRREGKVSSTNNQLQKSENQSPDNLQFKVKESSGTRNISEKMSGTEEPTETTSASTKNFQDEVRQWFTAMSPEERSAALGFEDDFPVLAALIARTASSGSTSSEGNDDKTNDSSRCEEQRSTISIQEPISTLPPKRTTDKLFPNGNCDWEARIAIENIENIWKEIMCGETSTPEAKTTNQNDKNRKSEVTLGKANNHVESIDGIDSNAMKTQVEASSSNNTTLDDASNNGVVSDAYRIPNEGIKGEGKATSTLAQDDDKVPRTSVISESCKPGDEGEMGKADINSDTDSSPSSRIKEESNEAFASASTGTYREYSANDATNSSTATHGIEADLNNSRRIAEVMDNTRCIFPASSKITTAANTGNHVTPNELSLQHTRRQTQPFISINPSYLQFVTGDELLVAFDEIMAMAFTNPSSDEPCSFILPEEATSASWIDLVRSYATASGSPQSIPLYILVLCRFQLSLAKSYSERNQTQEDSSDNISDVHSISHKAASKWLSVLMSRINELENTQSFEIQKILSRLASKLPEARNNINANGKKKMYELEQYLLLPFSVVAERLREDSEYENVLKQINSSIEESLQSDVYDSKDEASVAEATPTAESKSLPNETHSGSDITGTPSEVKDEVVANNGSTTANNGSKKSKKKKKKKKRKGGAGANSQIKTTLVEKSDEAKVDEVGEPEGNGNEIVAPEKTSIEKEIVKENDVVNIDLEVDEKASVIECEQPSQTVVTPCTETPDPPTPNQEENVKESSEHPKSEDTIDVSRSNGSVGVVHEQPKLSNEAVDGPKEEDKSKNIQNAEDDDEEDQWETVEVRPRGRKKSSDKSNSTRVGSLNNSNTGSMNGQNGKKKAPRSKETRQKTKTRRMVREILGSVLEAVEENARKRSRERAQARRNQASFAFANGNSSLSNMNSTVASPLNQNPQQKTGSSLRDILVRGKINNNSQNQKVTSTKSAPLSYSDRARALMVSGPTDDKNNNSKRQKEKPTTITGVKTSKALKAARALPADQNTIPTIASTNSAFTPSVTNVVSRKTGVALSSDSSDSGSNEIQKVKNSPSDPVKVASPSPPLPTLLSPGNNNSTSSSVASSLDAPHTGHHGNTSRQSENDVGCHLLDVCDKLSNEIAVFMKRREVALKIRRHERGLVLAALEKTLGLIWPGNPSVEMYGSCATNTDLPSSDLDVVVRGLDRPFVEVPSSPSSSPSIAPNSPNDSSSVEDTKKQEDGSPDMNNRKDGSSTTSDKRYSQHQMSQYQMQMMYGHMSLNAERVLRLAMELEHQPWAVHVKAIPTASVPVIKILADPAKLQGAAMNGNAEWLVQQPISGQSAPSIPSHFPDNADPRSSTQPPMSHFQSQQSSPLWRGADVVNGLLKVDITFEGPEHGGIGSTQFSKKVIKDFVTETGLPAERTPQVQVLMVLKELLAQRRSNEPFSGGLSSYALLLLVISMIGERSIIREELEKTERQRRVVAAGGGNSALRSTQVDLMDSSANELKKVNKLKEANELKESNKLKQAAGEGQNKKKVPQSKSEGTHTNSTKAGLQQNDSASKSMGIAKEPQKKTAWQNIPGKKEQQKPGKKANVAVAPPSEQKTSGPSSWASIARNKATPASPVIPKKKNDASDNEAPESTNAKSNSATSERIDPKIPKKPCSFADAVAKGKPMPVANTNPTSKKVQTTKKNDGNKRFDGLLDPPTSKLSKNKPEKVDDKTTNVQQTNVNIAKKEEEKNRSNTSSSTSIQPKLPPAVVENGVNGSPDSSEFPQGFHDVIEVLCSGETTPGKLLMQFLLFYGQHFESQSTAIDYSGTHERDAVANNGYSVRSSYMLRQNAGSYDPVTGMYTVDPIVIYDPLEGAENNNVARSCFAWTSIRWVFAQSYMTLSSAAEQNASDGNRNRTATAASEGPAYGHDESGHVVVDPSSPLLELLLSY